ncbi:MAG: phosphate acetyltransferase [Bacteroidia bacterium]|nr:phosphate acetyltransferase [Bacteroidia bacterium]MDW8302565.1 phosphate acetyltransferase [Bacteroidia bacterium]
MQALDKIIQRAAAAQKTVLFTEGEDIRIQQAARILVERGWAKKVILLTQDTLLNLNDQRIVVKVISQSEISQEDISDYLLVNANKGFTWEYVQQQLKHPLWFGAYLLKNGIADVAVSGAVHTTADVIRAGLRVLGVSKKVSSVSSSFLMVLPDGRLLTYADCGVIPYPTPKQLADIAIISARTHAQLTGQTPKVAMLSFSTKGSAKHEKIDEILQAIEIVKQQEPELIIDGELQFDAAFVPSVAARKAPNSPVAGQANVFIFPDLAAGNIAYKITERIGQATAIGPLLQGFNYPWLDLSRGCKAEDAALVAMMGVLMHLHEKVQHV